MFGTKRTYTQIDRDVPAVFKAALEHLTVIFDDVSIFGGCLTDSFIGQRKIHDIDVHVRLNDFHDLPVPVQIDILRNTSSSQRVPSSQSAQAFYEWTGMQLKEIFHDHTYYRLRFFMNDPDHTEIDLSIYRDHYLRDNAGTPFHLLPIKRCSANFTCASYSKEGTWAHASYEDSIADMSMHIFRDRGLRASVWALPYFDHVKRKYPELRLQNPELLAYRAANRFMERFSSEKLTPKNT